MPNLADGYTIRPYDVKSSYQEMFLSLCDVESPTCVILTDSKYGAAFFEHRYLSELLGVTLVEGSDLYVGHNGRVWARSMDGDFEVDRIYRRVEDLDLFVPGLTEAYLNHKVALVNALGTGAADDKLVFLWVPDMIRSYLGEEPVLEQAVSYDPAVPGQPAVRPPEPGRIWCSRRAQGYGGLGVYIMPDMGSLYKDRLARQVIEQPQSFIAQETLDFTRHIVFDEASGGLDERYVDLRVFATQDGNGKVSVFPVGLTRVSQPSSRVTNNSSGGVMQAELGSRIESGAVPVHYAYVARYAYLGRRCPERQLPEALRLHRSTPGGGELRRSDGAAGQDGHVLRPAWKRRAPGPRRDAPRAAGDRGLWEGAPQG